METQFEIISQLEMKHYVEFNQCIWRKRIVTVLIYGILGVISLVHWWNSFDDLILYWGVFSITQAILIYRAPWRDAKKQMRRSQKTEKLEHENSLTKFSDMIYDETDFRASKTPYHCIKEIYLCRNTIVLLDNSSYAVFADKNGFVKGTFDEFVPFIQEKCPQAKIRK